MRYLEAEFFGVIVDNGSNASIQSVTKLQSYRIYTENSTSLRKLQYHYVISTHRCSKCIGSTKIKFTSSDSLITFDALVLENIDSLLVLRLDDIDKLHSRGAEKLVKTTKSLNSPFLSLVTL